jgi:MoaA/NifB/PqqE/SkfB family radical SAM enzyme
MITIGGGEPTLHSNFFEFLLYSMTELWDVSEETGVPAVGVITNGSNTAMAMKIAKLAKGGLIFGTVSKDEYHDPIDPIVYEAFDTKKNQWGERANREDGDHRSINYGGGFIQPVGRAKSWGNHPFRTCACDSIFITPKGKVWPCACKVRGTELGTIAEASTKIVSEHFEGYCAKTDDYKNKVIPSMNGMVTA